MNMTEAQVNESMMQAEEDTDQYLTFLMAGEEYGVNILGVQEIKGWDSVTPIPNTPDHILGVINLRGTVVPVSDLRRRFGLPGVEFGPTTVIIVLRVIGDDHERTMGLVVDAVSEVYNVTAKQVNPAPDFGAAVNAEFVKGLTTVDEKMVILLDIDPLLNSGVTDALEEQTH